MDTPYDTRLPPDLRAIKEEIEGYARGYGLDFFETIFEVIDADDLNEVAAYGGFPTRYPHWSFGMAYEELRKSYDYGLSKIYELVINNDPCYAYLMRSNHTVDQKLVMSHVYGHCLAPETLVETRDGVKPITAVRVGDEVLTHTGAFRRVRLCARRQFKGAICCLSVDGVKERVRITAEHPVYLFRERTPPQRSLRPFSRWEKLWVPAGQVQVGDRIVAPCRVMTTAQAASDYVDVAWDDVLDEELYAHVTSVERQEYEGFVYNFSVEEDESYTLGAGFVVHNCDFFKNNAYFAHTNRKMMDEMANHGARIRRYAEKYGEDEVEAFVDKCMSIDDLIDIHSTAIKRRDAVSRYDFAPKAEDEETVRGTRFKSKDYMDDFINNPAALKAEEDERRKVKEQASRSFPEHPEKDVLLFLIEHAPLKGWQRDIVSIVRDEAYYFAPQRMTKVLNEGWACLKSGSWIITDRGLLPIERLVSERQSVLVSDGETARRVYDWAAFPDRETVFVRTRRGLEVEGSATHQLLLPDGSWKRLDALQVGDHVKVGRGANLWSSQYVPVTWRPKPRRALVPVSSAVSADAPGLGESGVDLDTIYSDAGPYVFAHRRPIRIPGVIDEDFGAFLGYMIGDGHISVRKRTMGLTTGDDEQADHFLALVQVLFGLTPRKKCDGGRWRVIFSSANVQDMLIHLGLKTGVCAREKAVPDAILRSPKSVVAAFLRALHDCDGHAGAQGIILATSSVEMSKLVQLLLLNFGILSRRRPHKDGCWHVHVTGKSAEVFATEIGFGLMRKQEALRAYIDGHQWFLEQKDDDEIVAIERRRADVFDISVEETHRYAAQGFINHNSYWHSTIMTQKALTPAEVVDFADHHSGTMAMQRTRINPYKLGIELLRDIEERWNTGRFGKEYDECEDLEKKRTWDKQLGLGRKKIFEVRRVHNDITFIDTFLTPEFCVRHNMFSFAYQEQAGQYYIESRDFEKIKQRLLFSLTNFGKPWIYVVDGNFRNRGELLLRHMHTGVELRLDQAADTLANIQFIWGRPVHLQTLVDGKPTTLSFDGTDHAIKTGGDADDPRKNAPAKTR